MAETPKTRDELEMAISPRLVAIIESLGLRIVPAEPTNEMRDAGLNAQVSTREIIRAAIAASPFAPEN